MTRTTSTKPAVRGATCLLDLPDSAVAKARHQLMTFVNESPNTDFARGLQVDACLERIFNALTPIADSSRPMDGWELVPSEPTTTMEQEFYAASRRKAEDACHPVPTENPDDGGGVFGYAYRALLNAARMVPRLGSAATFPRRLEATEAVRAMMVGLEAWLRSPACSEDDVRCINGTDIRVGLVKAMAAAVVSEATGGDSSLHSLGDDVSTIVRERLDVLDGAPKEGSDRSLVARLEGVAKRWGRLADNADPSEPQLHTGDYRSAHAECAAELRAVLSGYTRSSMT